MRFWRRQKRLMACIYCGAVELDWNHATVETIDEYCEEECPSGIGHFYTDSPAVAAMVSRRRWQDVEKDARRPPRREDWTKAGATTELNVRGERVQRYIDGATDVYQRFSAMRRALSDALELLEFDGEYDASMQARDWQGCELLLDEQGRMPKRDEVVARGRELLKNDLQAGDAPLHVDWTRRV